MMFRKPQLWLVCLALVGASSVGSHAFARQIKLDYEPKKGHGATYDVMVHSEASDTAGFSLSADMTSTVAMKIMEVIRDKSVPVGQNNVVGVTTELTQKNGSVKVVSGKTEKTFPLQDVTVQLTSDAKGMVKEAPAGMDKAILDLVAAVCSQVGAGPKVKSGQGWQMNLAIPCGNETVPVEVTWNVSGRGSVAGQDCVLITSVGKASREFKEGSMKKVSIDWTGEAAYAFASGKFARIAVAGTSSAALEDDSTAQGKFALEMVLAKKQASLPHSGVLAGFTFPFSSGRHFPMLAGTVLLIGLCGVAASIRRRTLRQAFACAMVLSLAIYGMPINTAEAATPGALLAFANLMNQTIMNAAGWTAAGAAGICMGEPAKAASLGVSVSSAPSWAAANVLGVTAGLTPDFVQPAVAEAPAAPAEGAEQPAEPVAGAESAGIFTGTNMLIGGGVLLAGGGIAAAAGGGGGGSSAAAPPPVPRDCGAAAILTDITTNQDSLTITIGPLGLEDNPKDIVTVTFNDVVKAANYPLGTQPIVVTLDPGKNCLQIDAVGPGGSDGSIDVLVVFSSATVGDQVQAVSIAPGGMTRCTINR